MQLDQLQEAIAELPQDDPTHTLSPFLIPPAPAAPDAHNAPAATLHADPNNQAMLSCLASTAPVSVFMRQSVAEDVAALASGQWLNGSQQQHLYEQCPLLHKFLQPHMQQQQADASLPEHVLSLLRAVAQVRAILGIDNIGA